MNRPTRPEDRLSAVELRWCATGFCGLFWFGFAAMMMGAV